MTATKVYFEIDGKPTPIDDCSWLMYAPCGCLCGVNVVGERAMTADEAWESLEPSAEQRRRDKSAGFRVVAGLRSAVKDLVYDCPHTPKWGVEKTPVPAGHQWARIYSSKPGRRKHLVPEIGAENYREGRWSAGHTAALCGSTGFHWSAEWYALDGAPECLACARKAKTT